MQGMYAATSAVRDGTSCPLASSSLLPETEDDVDRAAAAQHGAELGLWPITRPRGTVE